MVEKGLTEDRNLYKKDFLMTQSIFSDYPYSDELYSEMIELADI